VVEILEYQSDVSDDGAALYFFRDLAEMNADDKDEEAAAAAREDCGTFRNVCPADNENWSLIERQLRQTTLPPTSSVHFGWGYQTVRFGRGRRHEFDGGGGGGGTGEQQQQQARIRVDLCAIRLPSVRTDLLVTLSTPVTAAAVTSGGNDNDETFRQVLSSFRIVDWSLFGPPK